MILNGLRDSKSFIIAEKLVIGKFTGDIVHSRLFLPFFRFWRENLTFHIRLEFLSLIMMTEILHDKTEFGINFGSTV